MAASLGAEVSESEVSPSDGGARATSHSDDHDHRPIHNGVRYRRVHRGPPRWYRGLLGKGLVLVIRGAVQLRVASA
jgi:hypothetical protein